ncbi:MAG: protease HtpX [Cellvibrionales bacterium]|jgi:heat shock protein HtpX|nr:protease HtpX [Cellvibrionales bacterium]
MKRIALFLMTNLAVVLVLGIVLSVLQSYLGLSRNSTGGLLLLAFVFGMGGSVISLAISKWMALRSTGAQIIEQPRSPTEIWLVDTVKRQARDAGIGMPDVAIYDSPDVNAFATGMNRNKALVAVSTGLINSMSREEAEAVLGHEVSHVANGDMVTLTLIQGVVNTFVIFLARIIASVIGDRERGAFAYMATVFALEMVFGILASTIVAWFSRQREYRADAGGARLAGREKMIAALERLKMSHESTLQGQLTAFGINGKKTMGELFMSHPPLEKRIEALRNTASF